MNCDNCGLKIDTRWYEDCCPHCSSPITVEDETLSSEKKFQTLVLGKWEALDYIPECKKSSLLISIIDPDKDDIEDKLAARYRGMLTLKFSDSYNPRIDKNAFNLEQVKKIQSFLNEHDKSFDFLVVHCTAGISRSAAVVSGILYWFDMDNSEYTDSKDYQPNQHIYNMMAKYWNENQNNI